MASSPDDAGGIASARDPQSLFRQALKDLDDRLLRGEPFSGHERNCAFLNTGAGRWATVSHVSGFDFDDDARALAATDWDGDGDVDVWAANRTAPMLRYLRNDTPRAGDFLELRLAQDAGNRHAIGARVEVKIGSPPQVLVREVRAGDSFLSQSSLRLHFGLGKEAQITAVTVRWPGGAVETFTGVQPSAAFLLRKGTGQATLIPARSGLAALKPGAIALPPGDFPLAVPLTHSLPLPRLEFTDLDGKPRRLDEFKGAPLFVTFVSGEHPACAQQFASWQPRLAELQKAGLRLVAAGMDDEKSTRALLASLPAEIARGILAPNTRERVKLINNTPFEITLSLGAPSGFALDAAQRLITVYRGPATPDQLLVDVKRAALPPAQQAAGTLPFSGQWFRPPIPWAPLELLPVLLRQSDWSAAHDYMLANRDEFKKSRRQPARAKILADALIAQNMIAEALPHYQDALPEYPSDPILLNNLAHCLLHQPNPNAAAITAAVTHAEQAAKLTARKDPALLDTLAHALIAAGKKPEALAAIKEALALPGTTPELKKSLEELARQASRAAQ